MKRVWIAAACLLGVFPSGAGACEKGGPLQHPAQGEIFRNFSYERDPLFGAVRLHSGQDYKGEAGDPVKAAASGTVVEVKRVSDPEAGEEGYGGYVRIDHGGGVETAYGHLQDFSVKAGQCVSEGEVIASLGITGPSNRPHLHFEVLRDSKFVDPGPLLPRR